MCTLLVNKDLTVFQNVLLFVMSSVLILFKKVFFPALLSSQRLRCLLYAFLSLLLLVFKNLFLNRDLFIIYLYRFIYERSLICANISLLFWCVSLNSFIECCFESIKIKVVAFRGCLRYPIPNIGHKHLIIYYSFKSNNLCNDYWDQYCK